MRKRMVNTCLSLVKSVLRSVGFCVAVVTLSLQNSDMLWCPCIYILHVVMDVFMYSLKVHSFIQH